MEKKTSILIVDDDPGMTETMSDILGEIGYDIAVADDGYRAIEMIREKAYDIVLMDIRMPGINGVETLKEVKRISPSTRVIMMTAYSVEELVKEALDEGVYHIIYKPFDIDRVADLIGEAERGISILIVDDDPDICGIFRDFLKEDGYKITTALSGEEAIKRAKEKAYDIVFIDVNMSGLNGLETYLAIREVNPGNTSVMMTGYRQEVAELVEEGMKKNVYTCLYKPLNMDEVIAFVEKINRQRRIARYSRTTP